VRTPSVSDPDFTVGYQLIRIGVLVEVLRRLGFAFVTVQEEEKKAKEN
jgi:hypothetical protein